MRIGALVLSLLASAGLARAAEDAASLVRQSYEQYHRGESATEGWREIYDEGAKLAERAIELDPQNADARYALFLNLGRRAERSGIGSQILTVRRLRHLLEETVELDPRHADAWEALGEMLARLPGLLGGSREESERSYRRAIEVSPDWAKPWLRLAELRRDRDPAEAASLAERARSLACGATPPAAELCADATALTVELVRKETAPNHAASE